MQNLYFKAHQLHYHQRNTDLYLKKMRKQQECTNQSKQNETKIDTENCYYIFV